MSGADDLSTGNPRWDAVLLSLLHPTQLLIIEALSYIGQPLSPALLNGVIDCQKVELGHLDYHCKRMVTLGILVKRRREPSRGSWENFYDFA